MGSTNGQQASLRIPSSARMDKQVLLYKGQLDMKVSD